jgi:hypothetical protein
MFKNKKEELITKIIDAEWEMFQNVPNIGGTALCQEDRRTFEINRFAQAMSWSEALLESYLNDLSEAKNINRNLMTEKYGRMMESTSPEEYAQLEHLLLPLDLEVPPLIEKIVRIVLKWEEELAGKYPDIVRRSRPIYSSEDTLYTTSIETYLRGELATYSIRTLKLYYENILNQKSEAINGSEVILRHVMESYGFKSLQIANEILKSNSA